MTDLQIKIDTLFKDAVQNGDRDHMIRLLHLCTQIDFEDDNDITCLIKAIKSGQLGIVKHYFAKTNRGSIWKQQDKDEQIEKHLKKAGSAEVLDFFQIRGFNDAIHNSAHSILQYAVADDDLERVELILSHSGALLNEEALKTNLLMALSQKQFKIAKLLAQQAGPRYEQAFNQALSNYPQGELDLVAFEESLLTQEPECADTETNDQAPVYDTKMTQQYFYTQVLTKLDQIIQQNKSCT